MFFSVSLQRSGRSKEEEKTLTQFFNLAFNQKIHLSGWSKRPSLTSKRAGSVSRPRPTTRRPRPGPRRRGSGPPRGAPSRTRSLRRRGPSTTPRSRPRGGSVREQFLRLKKEKPSQNRERREGVASLFLFPSNSSSSHATLLSFFFGLYEFNSFALFYTYCEEYPPRERRSMNEIFFPSVFIFCKKTRFEEKRRGSTKRKEKGEKEKNPGNIFIYPRNSSLTLEVGQDDKKRGRKGGCEKFPFLLAFDAFTSSLSNMAEKKWMRTLSSTTIF